MPAAARSKLCSSVLAWSVVFASVCVCVCVYNWYKVMQAEGNIYFETKSKLQRFGSNEPSSGLEGDVICDVKSTIDV